MTEPLPDTVERFLEHKRAIGRKYHSEETELRLLVRFAQQRRITRIDRLTPTVLEDFFTSRARCRPRGFNHLVGAVACLMDWAVNQGLLTASPLRTRRRRTSPDCLPFLFDATQARRLLDAAAVLPDNPRAAQRGPTYQALFALCYELGLRAGEVVAAHRRRRRPTGPARRGWRQVRKEPAGPSRPTDRRAGRRPG